MFGFSSARNEYCDRGHYSVDIDAHRPWDIDYADRFPRYYMDYETAKRETQQWLLWRVERMRARGNMPAATTPPVSSESAPQSTAERPPPES